MPSRSRMVGLGRSPTLGVLDQLGLEKLLAARRGRDLVTAMIVARIVEPGSKLATGRAVHRDTAHSTLGELLGVEEADADELYAAMEWLLPRQGRIEKALAARHLHGTLVLYDVTSTYFEGRTCPLDRGREDRLASVPPPSEPDVRFSRIRLSGWWLHL